MRSLSELENTKNKATDRILVLKPIDDKAPKNIYGNIDPGLFTGKNKLHAIVDPETMFWHLKYEMGGLPEGLKQKFTSFSMLKKYADQYYSKRNLQITEVID